MAKLPIQKMKKNPLFIIILLLCAFDVNAKGYEDYNIEDIYIPEEYLGTYLPVDYEKLLLKYNSHEQALMKIKNEQYTVLFLKKDICTSNLAYVDGFAIKKENFSKWKFENINDELILIDEKGFHYRKISSEFNYSIIKNYILNILLKDFVNENLIIKDDMLVINNVSYQFRLQPSYSDKNVSFMVINKSPYFIIIEDEKLKLVGCKKIDAMQYDPTDEVIYECNIIK